MTLNDDTFTAFPALRNISGISYSEGVQFVKAARSQGLSAEDALAQIVREYAQLHAPHSVKA